MKKTTLLRRGGDYGIDWLGKKDSNLHRRIQSPLSYR